MRAGRSVRSAGVLLVALVGLLLGLSGCGGSAAGSELPVPTGSPVLLFDRSGRQQAAFNSPSGNVSCGFAAATGAETSATVRCEIIVKSWKPPAKPADCTANWGLGVTLGSTAAILCASDTVRSDPGSVVLPLGTSIRFSPFTCISQASGIDCENTTTGAGFLLTRDRYELRNP